MSRTRVSNTPWLNYDTLWCGYTLVCWRLRDVALTTPDLWTVLVHKSETPGSVNWAEICASRARHRPLSIKAEYAAYLPGNPLYSLPDSCWTRAGKISLRIDAHVNASKYAPFIYAQLPQLTQLRCVMYDRLSSKFLGERSTSLTHLHLMGTHLDKAPDLPTLIAFQFTHQSRTMQLTDIYEVIALLRGTPLLQTLALQFHAPLDEAAASAYRSTAQSSVALLELQSLSLLGHLTTIAFLTHILPFPSQSLSILPSKESARLDQQVEGYMSSFWHRVSQDAHRFPETSLEILRGQGTKFRIGNYFASESPAVSPRLFFGIEIACCYTCYLFHLYLLPVRRLLLLRPHHSRSRKVPAPTSRHPQSR